MKDAATALGRFAQVRALRVSWTLQAFGAESGATMKQGWQYWTFFGVGFAATIIVTIWVTKIARNTLREGEVA